MFSNLLIVFHCFDLSQSAREGDHDNADTKVLLSYFFKKQAQAECIISVLTDLDLSCCITSLLEHVFAFPDCAS